MNRIVEDYMKLDGFCPNCGNSNASRFSVNWPTPGLIQCEDCKKRWKTEELFLTAKLIEHPSTIPSSCSNCGSCQMRENDEYNVTIGFRLFRVECSNCHRIFWYAYEPRCKRLMTAKAEKRRRSISSYASYRFRFSATASGSINLLGRDEGEVGVVPKPKVVRKRFGKLYSQDIVSVKYTKRERAVYNFEARIPYHPAVRSFENNDLIYNEILNMSRRLVSVNKRGKLWDYLIMACIHVVLFQRDQGQLMPNLPALWKDFQNRKFYWKTYQKHLCFVISCTQPYIRNKQIVRKKPETWLFQMMQWYKGIHET